MAQWEEGSPVRSIDRSGGCLGGIHVGSEYFGSRRLGGFQEYEVSTGGELFVILNRLNTEKAWVRLPLWEDCLRRWYSRNLQTSLVSCQDVTSAIRHLQQPRIYTVQQDVSLSLTTEIPCSSCHECCFPIGPTIKLSISIQRPRLTNLYQASLLGGLARQRQTFNGPG